MAKISSPILFSQQFNIDPQILDNEGIFDPILNFDTKLFIDPLLLEKSKHKIIRKQAENELKTFYNNLLALLEESKSKDDFAYKSALKQLPQREIEGTCLGYGTNSISGRSMTTPNKEKIINTASEIIRLGIKKPELFIILPLFEEGIGSDTISDITTYAIQKSLFKFTSDTAKKLGVKTIKYSINGEIIDIIKNPLRKKTSPILLLPQDILRKLPFATTWDEIEDAARVNHELRAKFNRYITALWKAKTKKEKNKQLATLMKTQDGINTLIEITQKSDIKPYDFGSDKESIMFVRHVAEVINTNPLKLSVNNNDYNELKNIVKTIIEQFKFLIENKGINNLLWNDKKPNTEKTTQKIFLTVAYSYCKANDIDINPEMDSGVGNVDFKFSKGFSKKIIVEIKHSTNSNVINGFTTQLELYKKAEETLCGYYVVVDVGFLGKKLDKLYELYNDNPDKKADIIYVDGRLKKSASKRKSLYDVDLFEDSMTEKSDDLSSAIETYDFTIPEIEIPNIKIDIDDLFGDKK
jgi:hypothetical protein